MTRFETVPSFVYFIGTRDRCLIKIGRSRSCARRLIEVSGWSPVPLDILAKAPGEIRDEVHLHNRYREHWSHREWFRATPELMALIEEVKRTGELPDYARWTSAAP